MTKLYADFKDGWPLMYPLGKKETELLARNLVNGEVALGQVIGSFGQAIIATPHKVLVLKTGLMSGQAYGAKATAFDYRQIVGVEVRTGFTGGEFAILAAGLASNQGNRAKDKVDMSKAPNGVVFHKRDAKYFEAMAAKLREFAASSHTPQGLTNAQPQAAEPDVPAAIEKLAGLHAAGILTDEEFSSKKAELLARL